MDTDCEVPTSQCEAVGVEGGTFQEMGRTYWNLQRQDKNTACLGWSKWFSPPRAYYVLGWGQETLWGDLGDEAK